MHDKIYYVPAILWGASEREALKELSPALRDCMIPLIDIPPSLLNVATDGQSPTIDQFLARVPDEIAAAWGTTNRFFVDMVPQDSSIKRMDDLFAQMNAMDLQAIPVTGTDRSVAYQAAVAAIHERDRRGVCIRVRIEDLAHTAAQGEIVSLVEALDISPTDIDLILDFRSLGGWQAPLLRSLATSALTSMHHIYLFRTVTLLAGAFPLDFSHVAEGVSLIPRSDWTLWRSIRPDTQFRLPYFGDYTTRHPDQGPINTHSMGMIARIRYVAEEYWVVVKDSTNRNTSRTLFGKSDTGGCDQSHPPAGHNDLSTDNASVFRRAADTPIGGKLSDAKVATILHLTRTAQQMAAVR